MNIGCLFAGFCPSSENKGWFDITTIAMDERPMAAMQKAIRLIREADPAYKVALAGNFHPEIEADIDDYCIALGQFFPENILKERQAAGKLSTYYTCCSESYPNTFTFAAGRGCLVRLVCCGQRIRRIFAVGLQ